MQEVAQHLLRYCAAMNGTPSAAGELPLVLVIDDDEDVREGLVLLLQSAGYAAVGAANGEEALVMLRDGLNPCLILLDLWMPVKTGWGFRMEQMRDPRLARIPTVVLSADEARRDLQGVAATLPKPLDFERLFALVEFHCSQAASTAGSADENASVTGDAAFHWLPDWVFEEMVRLAREVGAPVVALEARQDELIFTISSGAIVRRVIPGLGQLDTPNDRTG